MFDAFLQRLANTAAAHAAAVLCEQVVRPHRSGTAFACESVRHKSAVPQFARATKHSRLMPHQARIIASKQTICLPHGMQHPRILVVGAGFAGLGAARRLKKAGFEDVVVLEASERVGGRASTIEVRAAVAFEGIGRSEIHTFRESLFWTVISFRQVTLIAGSWRGTAGSWSDMDARNTNTSCLRVCEGARNTPRGIG